MFARAADMSQWSDVLWKVKKAGETDRQTDGQSDAWMGLWVVCVSSLPLCVMCTQNIAAYILYLMGIVLIAPHTQRKRRKMDVGERRTNEQYGQGNV